jgi:hypothetical protein
MSAAAESAVAFLDMQQVAISALSGSSGHEPGGATMQLPKLTAGQKRRRQAAARARQGRAHAPAKTGWEDWLQ